MNLLASIPSPERNVLELGPLTIYVYGILIALGVIVAIVVSRKRYVRFGGSGELFEKTAIWAVIIGFLGARAGYVLTHSGNFTDRPYAVFFIWEGGLALYGGLLFGALTFIVLMHRNKGDLFAVGDATAIGIPLAQAIGRVGNYFNQELFGTPSDLPWAVEIDLAHRPAEYAEFATFHPTFLYELVWNAFILVPFILWLEKRGKLAKGASFGIYVAMYAFIRFCMELLRTDTTFRVFGISRNGWVSVLAFFGGLAWIWWTQRRAEKRTLVGNPYLLSPQAETEAAEPVSSEEAVSHQPSADSSAGEDVSSEEAGTRQPHADSAEDLE